MDPSIAAADKFHDGYRVGRESLKQRMIDWLRDPNRKPPELAFTAGPERDLAHEIERAIQREKGDA